MEQSVEKKRVLIAGGGFGGLHAAIHFEKNISDLGKDLEVVLVNPDNYSLFTPMLHEVATAEIEPSGIVIPLHKMLDQVAFVAGRISEIDLTARTVNIRQTALYDEIAAKDDLVVHFDFLLLALGSTSTFYDLPGVEANALTMKTITDAIVLRNMVLGCLESANLEKNPIERTRLLTFVVVGGGFAGVETVGGLNDFVREAIKEYANLDEKMLRVVLIHADQELLPEFKGELSAYTKEKLGDRGIEILLNTRVLAANSRELTFDDKTRMPVGLFVWTAGVKPSGLIEKLPCRKENRRILTNEFLEVPDFPHVWAIGDCAAVPEVENGGFYAPLAQHAERQGKTAAANILTFVRESGRKSPFRYRTLGQLASIGHKSGIARILGWQFSGLPAWILWRGAYLWKLPTLEKKLRVLTNWMLNIFFARDIVQLVSNDTVHLFDERERLFLDSKGKELVEQAGDREKSPFERIQ